MVAHPKDEVSYPFNSCQPERSLTQHETASLYAHSSDFRRLEHFPSYSDIAPRKNLQPLVVQGELEFAEAEYEIQSGHFQMEMENLQLQTPHMTDEEMLRGLTDIVRIFRNFVEPAGKRLERLQGSDAEGMEYFREGISLAEDVIRTAREAAVNDRPRRR